MWQDEFAKLMPMAVGGLRYRISGEADAELHRRLYNISKDAAREAVVRRHLGMVGLYVVEDAGTGQAIGESGFVGNRDIVETDTSIMLLPEFQQRGYGRRILRTLFDVWTNSLRNDTCIATTLSSNAPAISLLRSEGFTQVREYIDFFEVAHLVFERHRHAAAT